MLRQKRLEVDMLKLKAIASASPLIDVDCSVGAPERYRITYYCKGLLWMPGAVGPSITSRHIMDVYLHIQYPRTPPQLTWRTDIFHPNILPPASNGGVCIGSWTPAETLDQLIVRIAEMVQMKNYSVSDALNREAAAWVSLHLDLFPLDRRAIIAPEPEISFSRSVT